MKARATISACNRRSLDPSFGNLYYHSLLRPAISIHLNPAVDLVVRSFGQLNPVIADEGLRRFDQDYIARDTAVIPPVRMEGRDCILPALVAGLDHEEVIAVVKQLCHLKIEGRETSFVLAQGLAI